MLHTCIAHTLHMYCNTVNTHIVHTLHTNITCTHCNTHCSHIVHTLYTHIGPGSSYMLNVISSLSLVHGPLCQQSTTITQYLRFHSWWRMTWNSPLAYMGRYEQTFIRPRELPTRDKGTISPKSRLVNWSIYQLQNIEEESFIGASQGTHPSKGDKSWNLHYWALSGLVGSSVGQGFIYSAAVLLA